MNEVCEFPFAEKWMYLSHRENMPLISGVTFFLMSLGERSQSCD